jgi:hypothetical protein
MNLPIQLGRLRIFKIPDIGHKRLQKNGDWQAQPLERLSLNFRAASYTERARPTGHQQTHDLLLKVSACA